MNVRSRSGALVLALLVGPAAASAQGDASAVFVVRVGSDTFAVERATIGARRAEGVLRVRSSQQQVRQLVESDAAGAARHIVTMVGRGAHGDSAAKQLEITVEGDSATAQPFDAAAPALLPAQRIAVPRGAVPFVNLSGLSVEDRDADHLSWDIELSREFEPKIGIAAFPPRQMHEDRFQKRVGRRNLDRRDK